MPAPALHKVRLAELRDSLTAASVKSLPVQVVGEDEAAQDAWLAERLQLVCNDVLQYVNAYAEKRGLALIAHDLNLIPRELLADTLALAVYKVLEPVDGFVSELAGSTLKADYDKALADLRALRDGEGVLAWECAEGEELEEPEGASGVSVRARKAESVWMV